MGQGCLCFVNTFYYLPIITPSPAKQNKKKKRKKTPKLWSGKIFHPGTALWCHTWTHTCTKRRKLFPLNEHANMEKKEGAKEGDEEARRGREEDWTSLSGKQSKALKARLVLHSRGNTQFWSGKMILIWKWSLNAARDLLTLWVCLALITPTGRIDGTRGVQVRCADEQMGITDCI